MVSGQIVNIGSDEATVTVHDAARIVAEHAGVDVHVESDSPDKRDYRVSFEKLGRLVPELTMRPLSDGIGELVAFLQENADEFRGRPKDDFFRLALLRRQLDAHELDETLRRTAQA